MTKTDRSNSPSQLGGDRQLGADDSDNVEMVLTEHPQRDFESFCRDSYPVITRALVLSLNDVDLGSEAADEAFAVAWERWQTVSQMANPSGWVFRVGLNWGRSFLRRVRREVSWSNVESGGRTVDAPTSDPGLVRALAKLSADHRSVLVAKFYLDWSEAEIAAAMNIPKGTVKSRLTRAIEKLTNNLGGPTR